MTDMGGGYVYGQQKIQLTSNKQIYLKYIYGLQENNELEKKTNIYGQQRTSRESNSILLDLYNQHEAFKENKRAFHFIFYWVLLICVIENSC